MSLNKDIFELLRRDSESRQINDRKSNDEYDLFPFESLRIGQWDYSLPTLVNNNRKNKHNMVKSVDEFNNKFNEIIPYIFNLENLLIAGGSVSNILTGISPIKDIDIFLYGLTPENAIKRIYQLVTDIMSKFNIKT